MNNLILMWLAIALAFAFIIGSILYLRRGSKFKLPPNWQEIKKKNEAKWQDDDDA